MERRKNSLLRKITFESPTFLADTSRNLEGSRVDRNISLLDQVVVSFTTSQLTRNTAFSASLFFPVPSRANTRCSSRKSNSVDPLRRARVSTSNKLSLICPPIECIACTTIRSHVKHLGRKFLTRSRASRDSKNARRHFHPRIL